MVGREQHWLERAYIRGLHELDMKELMQGTIAHNTIEGTWETGVVSPSLVAKTCRLQRLKTFLGHDPQPGLKRMAVRQGEPDGVSVLNFMRGFLMEGIIVTALRSVLGEDRILGNAPTLLFHTAYMGADPWLMNAPILRGISRAYDDSPSENGEWQTSPIVFSGHPDMLVLSPRGDLELVQIKCPSFFKLKKIKEKGPENALETYGAQIATEMYIGRAMGLPIARCNLMLATWEGTPGVPKVSVEVIPQEWDDTLAIIPEEIARELIEDTWAVIQEDRWPEAFPVHMWDTWPCSYCSYSRNRTFDLIGCDEPHEWARFAATGDTRTTLSEPPPEAIPIRRRKRAV